MTKIMQTTGAGLPAKEIKGQRVVSYKQIAELHQVDVRTIRRNYERNADKFIQGVDYFQIKENNPDSDNLSHTRNYFTESGYLMLVKSLTDDLSWEVQRMLVNSYFRAALLEKVLAFLPQKVQKVVYYRSLGLTQKEAGLLAGMSRDSVRSTEKKLSELGYRVPSQNGKRSHFKAEQMELAL